MIKVEVGDYFYYSVTREGFLNHSNKKQQQRNIHLQSQSRWAEKIMKLHEN